jgi:hypothetical protein
VLLGVVVGKKVTVWNDGTADLAIAQITLSGANPDQFRRPAPLDLCSGTVLPPGGSCTVRVRANLTQTGPLSAALVIPSDDPDQGVITVPLAAVGQTPQIVQSPLAIDFGNVAVGTLLGQNVAVLNDGSADLAIGQITLGGSNPAQYRQPAPLDLCSGTTLPPGASCTVKVRFKPTVVGPLSATLVIPSTASNEAVVTVTLNGTGTP